MIAFAILLIASQILGSAIAIDVAFDSNSNDTTSLVLSVDASPTFFSLDGTVGPTVRIFNVTLIDVNVTSGGVSFTAGVVDGNGDSVFVPITLDTVPSNVSTSFSNTGFAAQVQSYYPQRLSVWSLAPTANMTASFAVNMTQYRALEVTLSATTIQSIDVPASGNGDQSAWSIDFPLSAGERKFFRLQTNHFDQTGRFFAIDQCDQPPVPSNSSKDSVELSTDWSAFSPTLRSTGDVVFAGGASLYPEVSVSAVSAILSNSVGFHLDGEALIAVESSAISSSWFPIFDTPDSNGTISVNLRAVENAYYGIGAVSSPLAAVVDSNGDLKFLMPLATDSPLRNASRFQLYTTCTNSKLFGSSSSFLLGSRCYLKNNAADLLFTTAANGSAVFEWDDSDQFLVVRNFGANCPNINQTFFGTDATIELTVMWADSVVWEPVELPGWRAHQSQSPSNDDQTIVLAMPLWAWVAAPIALAALLLGVGWWVGRAQGKQHRHNSYQTLP